jgi:hypothetical protein
MPSDIGDITWDMMSDAGIDISQVERRHTPTGTDEYVLFADDREDDGKLRVAFGPAIDEYGEPADGWDIATYERKDGELGGWDEPTGQDYARTAAEALTLVAAAVA